MNALDRIIEAVAPGVALKRARARAALELVRGYEGAAKGRRLDGWKTKSTGANTEIRGGLRLTRDRARDLVRNNPYAARAVSVIAANMVGYGIKTTIRTPNKKHAKPLQDAWKAWAESTQCDADGMHDIYGLQELAARAIPESGEVLLRRVWRLDAGLAVPFQVQVLEADYIDTTKEGATAEGHVIVQGKEYDKRGLCVAYWLFDHHPGDAFVVESRRVPADDIAHIYRMDRPGQVRGITWLAPVILRLRDFDEYEDAQLLRQKIAACFTAFIYDQEASGAEQTGKRAVELSQQIEPALIQRLPPGTNVTFANPPGVTGYSEYASVTLHAIAAGLGIPYESLTGDYSQVNFTSGRMGRAEFHALLDVWQWKMFVPGFCATVFRWFREAAELAGLPAAGATAKYTPPHRVLVDPTREIPAIIKAVRGGLQTLYGAIREMGYDPDEFLTEYAEGNKQLDALGIVLDTDPRRVAGSGQAQQANDSGSGGGETADDDKSSESKAAA